MSGYFSFYNEKCPYCSKTKREIKDAGEVTMKNGKTIREIRYSLDHLATVEIIHCEHCGKKVVVDLCPISIILSKYEGDGP